MPELERPDGARIHYEVRGDGPLVVFALGFVTMPRVYEGLIADLAGDHSVVTWDLRGCGDSSRGGPYSLEQDALDLEALIASFGRPAKVFAVAHGVNVAAKAARAANGSVSALVTLAIATAVFDQLEGVDSPAASRQIVELLTEQMRRDPRASLRSLLTITNPQHDEDELRARVDASFAYADIDATQERITGWLADMSALAELEEMGGRVHVIAHENDRWEGGTLDRVTELLPKAVPHRLEDGPLSRPDLTAGLIRSL